jgi:hypothetical protein
MASATLVLRLKRVESDGTILEIRVWRLPAPTPERPHGLKYSLFYGKPGERIVGYDNEAGKGDHRHLRTTELPYMFVDLPTLLADFRADVERFRGRST